MCKVACVLLVGLFTAVYGVPSTYDTNNVWVAGNLSFPFPKNALIGGLDPNGYNLYVARTNYSGSILPVRVVAETGTGYFNTDTFGDKVYNYQLLTTQPDMEYDWVRSFDGFQVENAVTVGTSAWNEFVYICRAKIDEGVVFGTLFLTRKVCHIKHDDWFMSKFDKYEVLVAQPKTNGSYY